MTEVRDHATAESPPLAVVILAAGRGSRLGPSGDDVPKWFLPVGARSIADWQLEGLRGAADLWSRVLVVTGYLSEAFDASALSRQLGHRCELVHNARYASHNNWLSLQLALSRLVDDAWKGSVCVLNSDLLLSPGVLRRFLETASGERTSIVAVDLDAPRSDEQMKIVLDPETDSVVDIGKDALTGIPAGEYVGLSKIDARHLPLLAQILDSFLHDPGRTSEWYEAAFRDAMRAGAEFTTFRVDSGRWIEVDDGEDLDRARNIVRLVEEED